MLGMLFMCLCAIVQLPQVDGRTQGASLAAYKVVAIRSAENSHSTHGLTRWAAERGQSTPIHSGCSMYGPQNPLHSLFHLPCAAGASDDTLLEAIETAVLFSHPEPEGRDGAVLLGAAVAWLAR